ncbi:MAG: hypothetical protein BGO43_06685 [Gammaproteobacteria bacterium 39-13]|nr:hypothetical protein [Gammaproteobacteria bacterium]OJV90526.1 MAG: hypothetical protein BGO43_06685 [Gammaproteobacteria bacterium 39-13]
MKELNQIEVTAVSGGVSKAETILGCSVGGTVLGAIVGVSTLGADSGIAGVIGGYMGLGIGGALGLGAGAAVGSAIVLGGIAWSYFA